MAADIDVLAYDPNAGESAGTLSAETMSSTKDTIVLQVPGMGSKLQMVEHCYRVYWTFERYRVFARGFHSTAIASSARDTTKFVQVQRRETWRVAQNSTFNTRVAQGRSVHICLLHETYERKKCVGLLSIGSFFRIMTSTPMFRS